jgi:hypothetical protein
MVVLEAELISARLRVNLGKFRVGIGSYSLCCEPLAGLAYTESQSGD